MKNKVLRVKQGTFNRELGMKKQEVSEHSQRYGIRRDRRHMVGIGGCHPRDVSCFWPTRCSPVAVCESTHLSPPPIPPSRRGQRMMDGGSASGEPDVGSIDLSSHLSGRRGRSPTRLSEHFQPSISGPPTLTHTRTHAHVGIYTAFLSVSNGR